MILTNNPEWLKTTGRLVNVKIVQGSITLLVETLRNEIPVLISKLFEGSVLGWLRNTWNITLQTELNKNTTYM